MGFKEVVVGGLRDLVLGKMGLLELGMYLLSQASRSGGDPVWSLRH